MTGCKETQCSSCIHREVCALKNDFLEACAAISNFTYTYDKDGSIVRISDVPFIKPVELQCKYYHKISIPRDVSNILQSINEPNYCQTGDGFVDNNTYLRG